MPVLEMSRQAADNTYLHRDFHNILNLGLDYLHDKYGAGAVADYLRLFAVRYYAPLIEEIRRKPLETIIDAFEKTYRVEESSDVLSFEKNGDELLVRVKKCPAVTHMKQSGVVPSPWFSLTSSVVWDAIAEAAGVGYAMLSYDETDGKAKHLFFVPRHDNQDHRQTGDFEP